MTISEVWCSRCDQPTVQEMVLSTGERKAYCAKHLSHLTYSTYQAEQAKMAKKGAK